MNVGQLRKLLEGLPDDADICVDRNQAVSPCASVQALLHPTLKMAVHVLVSDESKADAVCVHGWRASGGTVFNGELGLVLLDGRDADRGRRFTKARMRTLARARNGKTAERPKPQDKEESR